MRHLKDLLVPAAAAAFYLYLGWLYPDFRAKLPAFGLFALFFVLLPAIGLAGLLIRLPLSFAERMALGGPAALFTLFAASYGGAMLRRPELFWAQPALGILAFLPLFGKKTATAQDGPRLRPTPTGDVLLTGGIIVLGLTFWLQKALPLVPVPASVPLEYYTDDIFTSAFVFAAIRAMQHGLPVIYPMVDGATLPYHVLYHFCYGVCSLVTAIHPLDLVIFYWPPLLWMLTAGAVVTGCRKLAGFNIWETAIAAALILFTSGLDFNSTPEVQLYDYQHTFFLGLPAVILFCAALYGFLSGKSRHLFPVYLSICYFVCATTKAPLLLMLPLSIFPVFALRIVKRRLGFQEIIMAVLVILFGFVLHETLYKSSGIALVTQVKYVSLISAMFKNLGSMGGVLFVYVVLALFAVAQNRVLRLKLAFASQYILFCATYIFASAIILKIFNFQGGEFYFYWYARVLVFIAFAPLAAHVFRWRYSWKMPAAMALVLIVGFGVTVRHRCGMLAATTDQGKGSARFRSTKDLTADERAGLRWAATHLDHSGVFFTNKLSYLGYYMGGFQPMKLFDYAGISGLQGYAFPRTLLPPAGKKIADDHLRRIDDFLNAPSDDARSAALSRMNVQYYIHCIRIAPKDFRIPQRLTPIFRNAAIVIYKNAGAGEQNG